MRQRPSAVAWWPSWTGLVSQTRTTGADLKRLPTGKPVASSWCVASATIIDGEYSVMKPAGNSAVRT